jgi:hypothetical protein
LTGDDFAIVAGQNRVGEKASDALGDLTNLSNGNEHCRHKAEKRSAPYLNLSPDGLKHHNLSSRSAK